MEIIELNGMDKVREHGNLCNTFRNQVLALLGPYVVERRMGLREMTIRLLHNGKSYDVVQDGENGLIEFWKA